MVSSHPKHTQTPSALEGSSKFSTNSVEEKQVKKSEYTGKPVELQHKAATCRQTYQQLCNV